MHQADLFALSTLHIRAHLARILMLHRHRALCALVSLGYWREGRQPHGDFLVVLLLGLFLLQLAHGVRGLLTGRRPRSIIALACRAEWVSTVEFLEVGALRVLLVILLLQVVLLFLSALVLQEGHGRSLDGTLAGSVLVPGARVTNLSVLQLLVDRRELQRRLALW